MLGVLDFSDELLARGKDMVESLPKVDYSSSDGVLQFIVVHSKCRLDLSKSHLKVCHANLLFS